MKIRIPGTNRIINPTIVRTAIAMFWISAIILGLMSIGLVAMAITNTPIEEFDTVARNDLRGRLNDGDEEAIEYYNEYFIERNNYMFDGPLTIRLMAEKYNLDPSELIKEYRAGHYESAQEFYTTYVVNQING